MSTSMHVVLESGPIPHDVVPTEEASCGQNVIDDLRTLALVAARMGVPPLDVFLFDWCGAVEAAADTAQWRNPDPPPEWGDEIPIGGPPPMDPAYISAEAEYGRLLDEVAARVPWHQPSDGLVTVRALIVALETDPALAEECYGAVWDLQAFLFQLEYAERMRTRFYFGVSY